MDEEKLHQNGGGEKGRGGGGGGVTFYQSLHTFFDLT